MPDRESRCQQELVITFFRFEGHRYALDAIKMNVDQLEPGKVCRLARERLRSGGVLAIEVPDVSSGQARLRGNNWGMYIPDHVNYFTTATLRRLLEPIGFRLVGKERKYHFAWPNGVWWRDVMHEALSAVGMHSIITTFWRL